MNIYLLTFFFTILLSVIVFIILKIKNNSYGEEKNSFKIGKANIHFKQSMEDPFVPELSDDELNALYKEKLPVVEYDEEGFVKDFSVDDIEGIVDFFNEYGFVVVKNVLTDEECDQSIEEIWNYILDISPGVERDNPETWERSWPGTRIGFIGNGVANGIKSWENRLNKNIHDSFKAVYSSDHNEYENDKEDLMVSVDRYGIMKPTFIGEIKKKHWRGPDKWTHWDLNPWIWSNITEEKEETSKSYESNFDNPFQMEGSFITENNSCKLRYLKVQGLVALSESKKDDGGFQAVPGFHKVLEEWSKNHKPKPMSFVRVPPNDPLENYLKKITLRKGSLVIWSSELPHCNFPNNSDRFRICQYIKMFPKRTVENIESRSKALKIIANNKIDIESLDTREKSILGLNEENNNNNN